MKLQKVIRLINVALAKLHPALRLSGAVTEQNIESKLNLLLATLPAKSPAGTKPKSGGIPKKPLENALTKLGPVCLKLATGKRRGLSPLAKKLSEFVRTQLNAGASIESAFKQADRLGICGQ